MGRMIGFTLGFQKKLQLCEEMCFMHVLCFPMTVSFMIFSIFGYCILHQCSSDAGTMGHDSESTVQYTREWTSACRKKQSS